MRQALYTLILGLAGSVTALPQSSGAVAGTFANPPQGAPVVIPRAKQYDITSQITGRTYRIMVSTPINADPTKVYPAFYVLDANRNFEMATHEVPGDPGPRIVVGLGYATDDMGETVSRLRQFDLTPSVSKGTQDAGPKTGGGDAFLRVIEEEVKPFVMARYKIDPSEQSVYGHSLGGLMVLRALFRNPTSFSTFIMASPAIWWNDREVLADEATFSRRARSGELHLRILVTSAGDEQYRGKDSKLLAASAPYRMIDNASELADRLAALSPGRIQVERVIFPGENHSSSAFASLSRALRFAVPSK